MSSRAGATHTAGFGAEFTAQGLTLNRSLTTSARQDRYVGPVFGSPGHSLLHQASGNTANPPFQTTIPTLPRSFAPPALPLNNVWGYRAAFTQPTSGRGSKSCVHRQSHDSAAPLTIKVRPMANEDVHRPETGAAPLTRNTGRSTYRLVPVGGSFDSCKRSSAYPCSAPLTTSLASTVVQASALHADQRVDQRVDPRTEYKADYTATHTVPRTADPRIADAHVTNPQPISPQVEEPEASESQLYTRGRFAYTPEETEINDNSCISFAY